MENVMQFVVRAIMQECEVNTAIGSYYTYVKWSENNNLFKHHTRDWKEEDLEDISGLIIFDDSTNDDKAKVYPIRYGGKYYIMTDNGSTFAVING